jgi:hypothetical protein
MVLPMGRHLYNSVTAPDVALAQYDKLEFVDQAGLEVTTNDQYAQRINGKNQPFANTSPSFTPPYVYPRTQFGDTPYMAYEYKILTGYDTVHDLETFNFDSRLNVSTGLADIIGFTRFAYTPGVNVPNTDLILRLEKPDDEPLSPLPRTEFVQDLNRK